jgi:putative ABC transport system substrate-binding protein
MIRRREFINGFVGAAATWPVAARAQQRERIRRVGVLMSNYSPTDREGQASTAALLDTFQRLGWTDGRNIRIEYRWGAGDAESVKASAAELIRSAPDVVVVSTTPGLAELHRLTETAGPPLGVEVVAAPVHDAGEIERAIERLAGAPNSGLIVPTDNILTLHSKLIAELTTRYRIPAIYNTPEYLMNGGLMYYGYVRTDQFRQAAVYVDRILKRGHSGRSSDPLRSLS